MKELLKHALTVIAAVAILASCSKTPATPQQPVNPTVKPTDPVIATLAPSNISFQTANSGVRILKQGSSPIVRVRVRYSTNRNYVLDKVNLTFFYVDSVTSATECTLPLKTILRNNKYYVCATATTADNTTVLGNIDSFVTPRGIFERDTFGGGIVFLVDTTFLHGLVYAPSDQSDGIYWDNGTFIDIPGAKGTAVGTGLANTNAIITAQGPGNYAASVCRNYSGGGFHDWYLPSNIELDKIHYLIVPAGATDTYYWSSTQSSNREAWCAFRNDLVGFSSMTFPKNTKMKVRAIRSF